ncbi:hypothetical protein [Burkholderia ubonensis]|uniref:hypothetical protein n=1 Tax=Burkholderia ubonensis TaxID=101571 RepID=UPI000AF034FB|nr:hypothetical protein [Burkholderia ubonensis]
MPYYTVVDEGYDVSLFRSAQKVAARYSREELALAPNSETVASASDIKKALKAEPIVRLYALDANDWTYRIEVHESTLA